MIELKESVLVLLRRSKTSEWRERRYAEAHLISSVIILVPDLNRIIRMSLDIIHNERRSEIARATAP